MEEIVSGRRKEISGQTQLEYNRRKRQNIVISLGVCVFAFAFTDIRCSVLF